MSDQAGFVLKVVLLSTVISCVIKYGGRLLTLNPTNYLVLTIVLLPSLIMAITLGRQYKQQ
jgi:hypothetical protein